MFHGITKTIRIKENMQVKKLVFKRFSNASWSTPFFFFFLFIFAYRQVLVEYFFWLEIFSTTHLQTAVYLFKW